VSARIVGRERELAALDGLVAGAALVLAGDPGIGKTTLWEAALDVALLRTEPAGAPPEPRAIALALLNALRGLAGETPLLVAIVDVQWFDPPSADALAFAVRRLREEPVAFLLAKRPGRATGLERALEPGGIERLDIGPITLGAMRRLLSERLGLSLPRPLLRRVVDATLGNPLFALEVGRMLIEQGLPATGEHIPAPAAVEDLLGTRVERLDGEARRLLLAVALSEGLRPDELAAIAGRRRRGRASARAAPRAGGRAPGLRAGGDARRRGGRGVRAPAGRAARRARAAADAGGRAGARRAPARARPLPAAGG
jgi:hypothetical protein